MVVVEQKTAGRTRARGCIEVRPRIPKRLQELDRKMSDAQTNYTMALGAFRQQSHIWLASARATVEAAKMADPEGKAADDPAALAVFGEIVEHMRALAVRAPGMRQMFAAALGVG